MKYITIIFVLFHTLAIGQFVKITEIKRQAKAMYNNTNDTTITYPIIITRSDSVNKKINSQIQSVFIDPDYLNKNVSIGLDSAISNGLINMTYEVSFCRNNILSITINAESCGAYCTGWSTYFNFYTITGNVIGINDILKNDKRKLFGEMVFKKKTQELINYKSALKENLEKNVIDTDAYNWAIEEIDGCENSVLLNQFSLSASSIEIHDDCGFPHAILSLQPDYKLNYTYVSIIEFLNADWKNILME
jgi:hypothetical protein